MLPRSPKSRSGAGMLRRLCRHLTTSSNGMANLLIRSKQKSLLMKLRSFRRVGWSSLSPRASRKKRVLSVLAVYVLLIRLRSLPATDTFRTLSTVSTARAVNCWALFSLWKIKRALARQETKVRWHLRLTRNKYRISAHLTSNRLKSRLRSKKS